MGTLNLFSTFSEMGMVGFTGYRCLRGCDSKPLEELLELPDKLCVHCLHQDPKAWVSHQSLLCLQLLIDELMKGNAVHRVL